MLRPRLSLLLVGSAVLALAAWSRDARSAGWQEAHQTSDDVRIEVAPDGVATVQHHVRYRIVAGRFKTLDLSGIDPRADLSTEGVLTPESGGASVPVRLEPVEKTPGKVRVVVDDRKGLARGAYLVDVKYRLDLVATGAFTRDGAMWRLAWTAPPAPEGRDGARVVFDLPAAPTEPRLAAAAESTTTLATVRRSAERDELELVRAHVPRGEAVTWAARVDPKAFPRVTAPELRPPPPPEPAPPALIGTRLRRALVAIALASLAGTLAALLRWKQRSVQRAAELRGGRARPLLPLPWGTGPFAYGVVTSAALALLLWSSPVAGALLVVLAMALAAHRSPAPLARPRGRGTWQPLGDAEAFVSARDEELPSDALDVGTTRARLVFVGATVVVLAAAWLLHTHVPQVLVALPLAWAAVIPVFLTGTRAQLAPTAAELGVGVLRPARDALASSVDLAHVEVSAIGRVIEPADAAAPATVDEIRLVCAPRDRTPGLRAIELTTPTAAGGQAALPEVFVRFDEGSATADRIARLAVGGRVLRGRAPEERVIRVRPDEPTPASAASLVARLVLALEGRRASDRPERAPTSAPAWKGKERRRRLAARAFAKPSPAPAR